MLSQAQLQNGSFPGERDFDRRACQSLIMTTDVCSQLSSHALASELTKQGVNDHAAIPDLLPVLRLTTAVQIQTPTLPLFPPAQLCQTQSGKTGFEDSS